MCLWWTRWFAAVIFAFPFLIRFLYSSRLISYLRLMHVSDSTFGQDGRTALHTALENTRTEMCTKLIEAGIDLSAADKVQCVTCAHLGVPIITDDCSLAGKPHAGQLFVAWCVSWSGWPDGVGRCVTFDVWGQDGETSLILAVRGGNEAVIGALLSERHCDVNTKNKVQAVCIFFPFIVSYNYPRLHRKGSRVSTWRSRRVWKVLR